MCRLCLILIYIITCVSCSRNNIITPELKQAEASMHSDPDSALAILKKIPEPEKMDPLNYNTWNLLITQAENKNRIKATTDDRITMARSYFEHTNNKLRKAQCNFYAGQVALDLNKPDSAAVGYLRAIDLLEGTDHYELRGLAYHNYGALCKFFNDNELAVKLWFAALDDFRKVGNRLYEIYALRDIARGWYNLGKRDSAKCYYDKALELSLIQKDSLVTFSVYNSLSSFYKSIGAFDSSMYYVRESIRYNTDPSFIDGNYLIMGRLFMQMQKLDSACIYYQKAEQSSSLYTKIEANDELASYYRLINDSKRESNSLRKYIENKGKQVDLFQESKIKEVETLHNNERLLREKLQIEKENTRLLAIASLSTLLLLFAFVLLGIVIRNRKEKLQQLELQLKERDLLITENEFKIKQISQHLSVLKTSSEKQFGRAEQSSIKLLQAERDRLYAENNSLFQKSQDDLKRYKALRKCNKKLSDRLIESTDLYKMIEDYRGDNSTLCLIRIELVKELKILYPDFVKKLDKLAPSMDDKDRLICYMLKLNFSNGDIGKLLFIQPQTVSQYKSIIVKERFNREGVTLEDFLCTV